MDIQHQIRNNAEETRQFLNDLNVWSEDMKRKETALFESETCKINDSEVPPIRGKMTKIQDSEVLPKDTNTTCSEKRQVQHAWLEKEKGNDFVKQKKWAEAIARYTNAIEEDPNDPSYYANRAHCFLQLKKWREAETDCSTAIQLDSSYTKAFFRRSQALKELKQFREARDDLIEVLTLDPENTLAETELTKLDKILLREKSTSENFSDPIIIKPQLPIDKKQLAYEEKEKGNFYVQKKNWKSAVDCYTKACSLYPEDPSFYLNRALCFLKMNEPRKTVLDCIRVLELNNDNVKAYYRRALAYLDLGEHSKAHDDLLTAFKLEPSNQAILKDLNRLEKKLGVLSEEKSNDDISPEKTIKHEENSRLHVPKRITGERFLKLGGQFVNPAKKAAHLQSLKPMKKIRITKKCDKESILEKTFDDVLLGEIDEELPEIKFAETQPEKVAESECLENLEKLVDRVGVPRNNLQFVTTWNHLRSSTKLQYKFLKKVQAQNFPQIFKDALECDTFSEILHVLNAECVEAGDQVYNYLLNLSRVKRFGALYLFASTEDRSGIERLLDYCERNHEVSRTEFEELRKNYFC